jgi:hypothetical protein
VSGRSNKQKDGKGLAPDRVGSDDPIALIPYKNTKGMRT